MNEIDIYMRLIDNEEADKILKMFNISVKTNDLGLKKINILKIFRGQVNTRKKSINPFYQVILQHQKPKLKDLYSSEEEFFEALDRITNDKLPNYKKFANALLYYPDKTNEILTLVEENITNNRSIFYNINKLETIEDYKEYFIKTSKFTKGDFVDEVIGLIPKYIKPEYNKQLIEYCNEATKWDIRDLYNIINNISNENKENEQALKGYIFKYAYLKMHPSEELKIRQSLFMEILFEILNEHKLEIDYFIEEKRSQVNELKGKNYENQIKVLKKKNDEICKENSKFKKEVHNEMEEYNKKVKKLEEKNEKINIINSELKKEFSDEKVQIYRTIKNLKEEKEKIFRRTRKMDNLIEGAFLEYNQVTLFAVIHSMDIYACEKIFPEILFVSGDKLTKGLNNIYNEKVKYIYIQRNGISSKFIAEIESFCMNNNIQSKVFIAKNEKELIENISIIKNKIRGGI